MGYGTALGRSAVAERSNLGGAIGHDIRRRGGELQRIADLPRARDRDAGEPRSGWRRSRPPWTIVWVPSSRTQTTVALPSTSIAARDGRSRGWPARSRPGSRRRRRRGREPQRERSCRRRCRPTRRRPRRLPRRPARSVEERVVLAAVQVHRRVERAARRPGRQLGNVSGDPAPRQRTVAEPSGDTSCWGLRSHPPPWRRSGFGEAPAPAAEATWTRGRPHRPDPDRHRVAGRVDVDRREARFGARFRDLLRRREAAARFADGGCTTSSVPLKYDQTTVAFPAPSTTVRLRWRP